MQHIRLKSDCRQALQHSPVIEGKALTVIHIPVNAIPAEVIFVVDEIDRDTVIYKPLNSAILIAPAYRHIHYRYMLQFGCVGFGNPFVFWQYYTYIYPGSLQRFGQSSNDIGQASRFDKRMGFSGSK
ncbi:hypothetical protein D3C80_1358290 [compost metagenome]